MRRVSVELRALLRETRPVSEVLTTVRKEIPALEVQELVTVLKTVSELEKPRMLPLASEMYAEMLRRAPENVNHEDAVRLLVLSARMRLFDSEVLNRISGVLRFDTVNDLKRIMNACNTLEFVFQNSEKMYEKISSLPVKESQLQDASIPLLRYVSRDIKLSGMKSGIPQVVQQCIDALASKVEALRNDEELLKQRIVVNTDDALKFIVPLAKIVKSGDEQCKALITDGVVQDIKFVLTKVVAYDLRNLNLDQLLKLFFSLREIEVFDDFFIRRRLVPAIAHSYKASATRTSKETLLVATALSQLPFQNQLVDELVQIVAQDAEKLPLADNFAQAIQTLLHSLTDRR